MELKHHILIGFVASYILIYFFEIPLKVGIVIFLSSVLIDFDHYIWYGAEFKDWNPLKAVKWYQEYGKKYHCLPKREKEKYRYGVFIFHGILFWLLLAVFGFFVHRLFFWILAGIAIHILSDQITLKILREPFYVKFSALYTWKRNKNKKKLSNL